MHWPKTLVQLLGLLLGLWLLPGDVAAQERHLYTYTLHHALPEQVLPALTAQLGADSSITSYHQQLILKVTAPEYRTLNQLLAQLDTAPRSLLISVRNQNQTNSQSNRYGVEGRIGDGAAQVQSGAGRLQTRSETRVTIRQGSSENNSDGTQQVRAVEGMAAFISAGQVYPVRSDRYGSGELVPVTSGFYATVRVVDNDAIVDIDQHDDRMQGHSIETQGLETQVRGKLGTWIPLGALQSTRQDNQSNVTSYGANSASSSTDLAIKVDLAE